MPLVHFRRHAGKPKGRDYRCKRCVATKARESRAANPKAKAEANARYVAKALAERPEEYRAGQRAADDKYHGRKRRNRENARQWRADNTERVSDYRDETREKRLAQARAGRYRRRVAAHLLETEAVYNLWHSLNGTGEPAAPIDARALVAQWEANGVANTCRNGCGKGWRAIVHAVPLYEGGEHTAVNLLPECGKTNCSPAGLVSAATATDRPNTSTT
jgi:hypothetical protein